MPSKVFLATLVASVLFVASGAIELGFSVIVGNQIHNIPKDGKEATRNLLYQRFPLTVGIVNGAFILATFFFMLPGLMSNSRGWLKSGGYMITVCGLFTLCVGVYLWVMTLRIKEDFFSTYLAQDPNVQSLIQTSVRESSSSSPNLSFPACFPPSTHFRTHMC